MGNYLHTQFHALADPTRLAVVERLLKAPASVSELAEPYDMALPAFTKHLGVLERSGLITSEKTGRVRTCSINPAAMSQIERWFSDRRALWDTRLDNLAAFVDDQRKK
ncbi:MAG: winged helix-turn-helix transcriptional regulator [Paracoccus denitrificans]|uniref:Winged helix-turn-helix transcriptional regulator n=1 Tax=Paracoccus denitrificans TaxID=266 RepID=A0A533I3K4_PARDE|nr:MAG: winged helix-turn-helix transcriptional regulator [Paracoccus denitrificans]